jgi:hypothetical protein
MVAGQPLLITERGPRVVTGAGSMWSAMPRGKAPISTSSQLETPDDGLDGAVVSVAAPAAAVGDVRSETWCQDVGAQDHDEHGAGEDETADT